jgi:multidrug transporter EmrE-like cation transporter
MLFTASDVLARTNLKSSDGLSLAALLAPWFVVYLVVRQVAMVGQLYVLASVELGRTAGLFAAMSLLAANAIGVLFLGDVLTGLGYLGVALALAAMVVLTVSGNV